MLTWQVWRRPQVSVGVFAACQCQETMVTLPPPLQDWVRIFEGQPEIIVGKWKKS